MSIDRTELQDAARKAFGDHGPAADAAKSWTTIADMGCLMMTVPEALGGLGLGRDAEAVIHTELGRALVPGPAIAQMLVIAALCAADTLPEREDLLARAMGGEVMTSSLSPLPFRGGAGGGVCPGNATLVAVPDADQATHILIIEADRILLQPMAVPGITVTQIPTWDETRRLFDVTVADSGDAFVLVTGDAARTLADQLQSQLLFALAGDSLGLADALLERTIDYLGTRQQFDRPLAMFQALKHRVADMKIALVAADALYRARAKGAPSLTDMGALKAHATTAASMVAEEAVQLHGGIGLTSEYYCHRFLKRALLNAALGGDADHWEQVAGAQALAAL